MLAPSTTAIDNDTQIYICQRSERPLHPLTINTDMLLNSHASVGTRNPSGCIFYFNYIIKNNFFFETANLTMTES